MALPSTSEIRNEANAVLESLEMLELSRALQAGDRIKSFTPYMEFLKQGDHAKLHLRQLADAVLWELREMKAKSELRELQNTALNYVLSDK